MWVYYPVSDNNIFSNSCSDMFHYCEEFKMTIWVLVILINSDLMLTRNETSFSSYKECAQAEEILDNLFPELGNKYDIIAYCLPRRI